MTKFYILFTSYGPSAQLRIIATFLTYGYKLIQLDPDIKAIFESEKSEEALKYEIDEWYDITFE